MLPEVQPRIVCALTNRAWDTIVHGLGPGAREIRPCRYKLARVPIAFRIPGCEFTSVLVKPHNHPSRFLSNTQIDLLGRACEWLTAKVD